MKSNKKKREFGSVALLSGIFFIISFLVLLFTEFSGITGLVTLNLADVSDYNESVLLKFDEAGTKIIYLSIDDHNYTSASLEIVGEPYLLENQYYYPSNPVLDILNNNINDWNFDGTYDATETINFADDLNIYLANCESHPCIVAIEVYSESAGAIVLENLVLGYDEVNEEMGANLEGFCGDGMCEGETCEDCPEDCGDCPPECGDGDCNGAETCEDCPEDCGDCPPECGNDIVEAGEECDGIDDAACPGACDPGCFCLSEVCGNDIHEGLEECDGTDDSACPGECSHDCLCPADPVCGNSILEGLEECDGTDDFNCPEFCTDECLCLNVTPKMHFIQYPDSSGWDVDGTYLDGFNWYIPLADDWQCSETGNVTDIHLWGSWSEGFEGVINKIHLSIHDDVPDSDGPGPLYSMPGENLWECNITNFEMTVDGNGNQGWIEFNGGVLEYYEDDHSEYHRIDITDFSECDGFFEQQEGNIYWLDVWVNVSGDYYWGWKTTLDHFNDAAVYLDSLDEENKIWRNLSDPLTPINIDFAFAITGEEATAPVCIDLDIDGYGNCPNCDIVNGCIHDGDDCNDSDILVNPGAVEICNDYVDNDCDLLVDCSDSYCSGNPICGLPNVVVFNFSFGSTNFSNVSDLTNVTNLALLNQYGGIQFPSSYGVNATGEDYDTNVVVGPGFVSVNTAALDGSFNASANVTINNVSCPATVYYGSGTFATAFGVVASGNVCAGGTDPSCSNIQCVGGTLTFTASHFTGFASAASSNLTIWDSTDPEGGSLTKNINEQVKFYANYSNSTSSILGADCEINFSDSVSDMVWNASSGFYEYNRSFTTSGTHDWNVTCNKTGYDKLLAFDDIFINGPSGMLNIEWITPAADYTVPKGEFFIVRQNITCTGGYCGNVKVVLDPAGGFRMKEENKK